MGRTVLWHTNNLPQKLLEYDLSLVGRRWSISVHVHTHTCTYIHTYSKSSATTVHDDDMHNRQTSLLTYSLTYRCGSPRRQQTRRQFEPGWLVGWLVGWMIEWLVCLGLLPAAQTHSQLTMSEWRPAIDGRSSSSTHRGQYMHKFHHHVCKVHM